MEFHALNNKFLPTCAESRWKKARLSFGGYNGGFGPLLGDTGGGAG